MFWKKRKVEVEEDLYLLEFKNYIYNEDKRLGYKAVELLYKKIKQYYTQKIKENSFDIKIERVQLESDFRKLDGPELNVNAALLIGIITAVFPGYLETFGIFTANGNAIVAAVSFTLFLIVLALQLKNPFKKNKRKVLMLGICLRVLEDIEAEAKESEIKVREEAERVSNQQMFEQLNDPKRMVKHIAITALEEVAVGLVKKDSLVRKIFRKKSKK